MVCMHPLLKLKLGPGLVLSAQVCPYMIVNYFMNKFGASLTDDARVIIYNRLMFIVQATDDVKFQNYLPCLTTIRIYHPLKGVTNPKYKLSHF